MYKKTRNSTFSNLPSTGEGIIRRFVAPEDVHDQIMFWFQGNEMKHHAFVIAAVIGYNIVRIHPFSDTNGRTSRLLMAMVLLRRHYSPAVIQIDDRDNYMNALAHADETGNLEPFIDFLAESLLETQEQILII